MCSSQVIRDKKTKKSKGFGIISLLDGGDFAKVRDGTSLALRLSQYRRCCGGGSWEYSTFWQSLITVFASAAILGMSAPGCSCKHLLRLFICTQNAYIILFSAAVAAVSAVCCPAVPEGDARQVHWQQARQAQQIHLEGARSTCRQGQQAACSSCSSSWRRGACKGAQARATC